MKRLFTFIAALSLLSLACQTLANQFTPGSVSTDTPVTQPTAISSLEPPATNDTNPPSLTNIRGKLAELGGLPCENKTDFVCVKIKVPLDHFDPSNTETIDVVFAVLPAKGQRFGMYVQAYPGGPGGKGISVASTDSFSKDILEHYDLVFFDQRGLGLSDPLECKKAYSAYFMDSLNTIDSIGQEGLDTPGEQKTAIQKAKSFVNDCVVEIGIDPAKIKFFVTDQVAEDIESFRQAIGDDKFMLYGCSYGTSVAQTYARKHADHLSGLIIDGVQDTTQSGDQIAFSQWEGINNVLLEVFKACDADSQCSQGMPNGSQAAYDKLAQKLADAPITFNYPLANGTKAKRQFTFNMLDFTVSYLMYGVDSRLALMRAIVSADAGDLSTLAQYFYIVANIDPETGQYVGDPTFSDTLYYIVWCEDDAYYSGTPDERTAQLLNHSQPLIGLVPRLDLDVLTLGLTCPYWPGSPSSPAQLEPLKAPSVPTLVLSATLDPATPFHEAKTVYENLDNGYFIYVKGGEHVIFGRGHDCPDQYITDFLVNGALPPQRETICDWGNGIIK